MVQVDRQYDAPLPVVDLAMGKCKPGKVSRTVSSTPLTLDLTVVCLPILWGLRPLWPMK